MRFAFELARTRPRRKVTSVTKCNAQQYGMVLWDEVFARVAAGLPRGRAEHGWSTRWPRASSCAPSTLDVVVASNLFADILSDLGCALAGSLGRAASANLNPDAALPEHVRAGPRLRAGHRRAGHLPTRSAPSGALP